MAILTPSQLVSASNATYFDNTSGSITPTSVRSLNDNWISSSILASQTSSLTVLSSSYAATASVLLGSVVSASYALSSSYALNATTASYAATASFAQNASDILVYVKNSSGAQINKGTVVRIVGSVGDNALIATASYTDDNNSANTLGITNETISNGAFGYVMTEGTLIGVDTTAFTAGQLVYLGLDGAITGSAPVAPLHNVRLGEVLRVQLNNGSIYVRVDNGYELGELHDVRDNTTTGSYGDLLVKSGSIWINSKQLTGSYGLTGSLTFLNGGITGSLFGTASNAVSASYALTASFALNAGSTVDTGSFATTGSNTFTGTNNFNIISASFANVLSASIDYLYVLYQTSSIVYSSGSNQFGDAANDVQTLYGTVDIKTGPLYLPSGSAVKFQMNTSTQSLQLQKHNVLNELIVLNPDSNEKIIGFDYDTLRTKIQFGIDTGIRFEGIDAKGRTINISSSLELQNTLNVLGDSLLTGSLVVKPSQISTDFPFIIDQASDGTSRGGNLISARNTSISTTGSVIVSGSQNLILLSAGGDTSEFGTGSAAGFTATNSIVTSVPFLTGSNGSGYNRPLPTFTNSLVSAPLTVTDNRPSTTTTPLTIQQGNVNANISFTTSTGSVSVNRAVLAGTGVVLTVTGSSGATKNISSIGVVGNTNTLLIDSPSAVASYTGLFIAGTSNTVLVSGSNTTMQSANLLGYQLRATGSAAATTNYGSLFAGRWNAIDNTALTKETAFLVGTGAANATRRTSFHVSASGLTTVSNGLTVTGSTSSSFNVASTFNQGVTFNQTTTFNQTPSFNAQANFGNVVSFTGSRFAAIINNTNDLEALDENRFGINVRSKNFTTSGSEYFITVNTGSNSTSHTLNAQYGGTVGSVVLSNSTGSTSFAVTANTISMSGSLRGNVVSASIASNTSSLDFSQGNFYTSLVTGTTNFNITNPGVGQTVNLLLTTAGTGASASFSSNVKQISGSVYTPTSTAGAQDILTFISWDGSSVYLANVKNLI